MTYGTERYSRRVQTFISEPRSYAPRLPGTSLPRRNGLQEAPDGAQFVVDHLGEVGPGHERVESTTVGPRTSAHDSQEIRLGPGTETGRRDVGGGHRVGRRLRDLAARQAWAVAGRT